MPERTLVLCLPPLTERGEAGSRVVAIEEAGFRIRAAAVVELSELPGDPIVGAFMAPMGAAPAGEALALVVEGDNAVKALLKLAAESDGALLAAPGQDLPPLIEAFFTDA